MLDVYGSAFATIDPSAGTARPGLQRLQHVARSIAVGLRQLVTTRAHSTVRSHALKAMIDGMITENTRCPRLVRIHRPLRDDQPYQPPVLCLPTLPVLTVRVVARCKELYIDAIL